MKTSVLTAIALLVLTSSGTAIKKEEIEARSLNLERETYFTDTTGKALPERMIKIQVGKLVRIYRTDGFHYTGKITEIDESNNYFKIYGVVFNVPDTQFGFVMSKGGVFAGAVVEPDKDYAYVLEYSDIHKGFVLVKSTKYNKPRV